MPLISSIAAEGATASELILLKGQIFGLAFVGGIAIGTGINYLPKAFSAEKTVGDHIGDGMTAVFGHPDRNGSFFKACEFLGLA
jgi:hypothetical protein